MLPARVGVTIDDDDDDEDDGGGNDMALFCRCFPSCNVRMLCNIPQNRSTNSEGPVDGSSVLASAPNSMILLLLVVVVVVVVVLVGLDGWADSNKGSESLYWISATTVPSLSKGITWVLVGREVGDA